MSVYAIQAIDGGPIKVGWSTNPQTRLSQLQGAHHSELVILYSFEARQADESYLHDALAHRRVRGEWFEDHPDVLVTLLTFEIGTRLERLVRGSAQSAMRLMGHDFDVSAARSELVAFAHVIADALTEANEAAMAYVHDRGVSHDDLRAFAALASKSEDS